MTNRFRTLVFKVAICLLIAATPACRYGSVGPGGASQPKEHPDKPEVRVALLASTSEGTNLSAVHAMQGARLAFDSGNDQGNLPVYVISDGYDTEADIGVTRQLLSKIISDPSYVAVVGWPSPKEAGLVADTLATANMPYVDLSPAGPELDGSGGNPQLRMVAPDSAQAAAMSSFLVNKASSGAICIAGVQDLRDDQLAAAVSTDLLEAGARVAFTARVPAQMDNYEQLVGRIKGARCDAVYWAGGGTEAGIIRTEMAEAGLGAVTFAGSDDMRTQAFLDSAEANSEGSMASCPCRDLNTQTGLDVEQFIQNYQSKYGVPPSAFAAEGFDAGNLTAGAIRAKDSAARASIAEFIGAKSPFTGISGKFEFDQNGELVAPAIEISEAERGSWVVVSHQAVSGAGSAG